MDDPRWLRLVTIGLVLSAIAVGYFLFSGKLSSNSTRTKAQITKVVQSPQPSPIPVATASPSPKSAYAAIVSRTQSNVQTLPNTGFPVGVFGAISTGVAIAGWGLRRFPH